MVFVKSVLLEKKENVKEKKVYKTLPSKFRTRSNINSKRKNKR